MVLVQESTVGEGGKYGVKWSRRVVSRSCWQHVFPMQNNKNRAAKAKLKSFTCKRCRSLKVQDAHDQKKRILNITQAYQKTSWNIPALKNRS